VTIPEKMFDGAHEGLVFWGTLTGHSSGKRAAGCDRYSHIIALLLSQISPEPGSHLSGLV
jgi:hypothetical protein